MFINPIEILELQHVDAISLDVDMIKKAKRKLFADIDLSEDEGIDYKGRHLSKSDCEKAIDELENSDKREFYCHLAGNQNLNDYLVSGDEKLFAGFKQEGIYKLDEFIRFVSPYFSERIDKSILNAFKSNDQELLKLILRTQIFVATADMNVAFRSLSLEIQHRIDEMDQLKNEISEKQTNYTDANVSEIAEKAKTLFPAETLNLLPAYFQSQINKIADSLNYLSLEIWGGEFISARVPMQLLEVVLSLNIESVTKPTFEKNLSIYQKRCIEQEEREKHAPALEKWENILTEIKNFNRLVENSKDKIFYFSSVAHLFTVEEINNLPSFANETRNDIAYAIRSLSISCWNAHNDIKTSLDLIDLALKLKVSEESITKFRKDREDLLELEKKYKGVFICHFCDTNGTEEGSGISKTIYKETERTWIPRSVKFSYIDVVVPRCEDCKQIHSKGKTTFWLWFVLLLCVGLIVGALIESVIIGGVLGLTAGWITGAVLENSQVDKTGIQRCSDSILKEHPMLVEKIREGWTFNKPSA